MAHALSSESTEKSNVCVALIESESRSRCFRDGIDAANSGHMSSTCQLSHVLTCEILVRAKRGAQLE